MNNNYVLAMYDIRGIQNYIFRTTKLKDAIGASAMVEDIIEISLQNAVKELNDEGIRYNFTFEKESLNNINLPEYEEDTYDIQVLYIGGGNGVVLFSNEELCVKVNKKMAMSVLRRTYSLQLAVAYIPKTESYSEDYRNLFVALAKVKANMEDSKPLGALPIMELDKKSGYPLAYETIYDEQNNRIHVTTESLLKREREHEKRKGIENSIKKFDTYALNKGSDSTIAVVHMDGNNMGLRIRSLLENIDTYKEAVDTMRMISSNINSSYKEVYKKMETLFNTGNRFMLSILVAGDDITYVCTGKTALASVEYFAREISKLAMNGQTDDENLKKYGFSICAGIAYINSHFPFSIAYEVAENCCDSAKDTAKLSEHLYLDENIEDEEERKKFSMVGNWVDFQICKNVNAKDLESLRDKEYITSTGENLVIRPYELPFGSNNLKASHIQQYSNLINNISYFQNEVNIPRSYAKKIRNTYSFGKVTIKELASFLRSRGHKMPDNTFEMYDNKTALWYDALELLDDYEPLSIIENDNSQGENHE